jgi:hypothetical protein
MCVRGGLALTLAKANPIRLDDPEFSNRRSIRQRENDEWHQRENHGLTLPLWPENDYPRVLRRRIGLDVREIQVQGEEDLVGGQRPAGYQRVLRPVEAFIENRVCLEAVLAQNTGALGRQVLIDL